MVFQARSVLSSDFACKAWGLSTLRGEVPRGRHAREATVTSCDLLREGTSTHVSLAHEHDRRRPGRGETRAPCQSSPDHPACPEDRSTLLGHVRRRATGQEADLLDGGHRVVEGKADDVLAEGKDVDEGGGEDRGGG